LISNSAHELSLLIYNCLHQAAQLCLAQKGVSVSATDTRCHLRFRSAHTATWQFHESDWQDTEEVSLCLVRCCGTHYHWLWCIIDTESGLRTTEIFFCILELRDIIITPLLQFRL